ncbi:MAG: hypothetical protein EOP64_06925 [Sphingomonas sp.]|nr:MAG: hypothetical protein EOP64_06925 [Sphingomonas sp.]
MTTPLARFAGERRALSGLVNADAAAPALELADDGTLVPMTRKDAAPGNAADSRARQGRPRGLVDQAQIASASHPVRKPLWMGLANGITGNACQCPFMRDG